MPQNAQLCTVASTVSLGRDLKSHAVF